MSKGLGIAALVIALLGVIVPLVTVWVIWLALGLAAFAAFSGDKSFPIAAVLVCLVNILFLSPLTLMMLKGESMQGGSSYMMVTIVAFIAPIVGLFLSAKPASSIAEPISASEVRAAVTTEAPLIAKTCPECGHRYPGGTLYCNADGAALV